MRVTLLCLIVLLSASALAQPPCFPGRPPGTPPPAPKGPFAPGKGLATAVRQGLNDGAASADYGPMSWGHFSGVIGEGGAAALEQADQAAVKAYNDAIASGFSDGSAHRVSADAWKTAWQQSRPRYPMDPPPGGPGGTAPMPTPNRTARMNSTTPMDKVFVGASGMQSPYASSVPK